MDVKIQQVPQSNFSEQLFENKWQLIFIRWWMTTRIRTTATATCSTAARPRASARRIRATCSTISSSRARPSRIQQKRLEIYRQAEKIIQTDVGYMPLVYRRGQLCLQAVGQGLAVNKFGQAVPDGNIYVRMLTKVSVEGRES